MSTIVHDKPPYAPQQCPHDPGDMPHNTIWKTDTLILPAMMRMRRKKALTCGKDLDRR